MRSTPSVALHILRSVEETLIKSATHNLCVRTRPQVAFYILNQKRTHLRELEERFGVVISVVADEHLTGQTVFAVDRMEPVAPRAEPRPAAATVRIDAIAPVDEPEEADEVEEADETEDREQDRRAGPRRMRASGRIAPNARARTAAAAAVAAVAADAAASRGKSSSMPPARLKAPAPRTI